VAQVSVLGPCTFLVTASVTGERRTEEVSCVSGVVYVWCGMCMRCGMRVVWCMYVMMLRSIV
jgi:hypothetical protein